MASTLLDIAPVSELVKLPGGKSGKQQVEVFGVSATGIAVLFDRFPEIRQLVTGQSLDRGVLAKLAPDAIAAIIAASCGSPGNAKAEAIAARLPLEAQMDILEATIKLTMPDGLGPFVERLTSLAGMLGGSVEETTTMAADTKSPSPSSS